jgi:hypothetical protein
LGIAEIEKASHSGAGQSGSLCLVGGLVGNWKFLRPKGVTALGKFDPAFAMPVDTKRMTGCAGIPEAGVTL